MPVTLTSHRGRPAVEIADAAGEIWLYLFDVTQRILSWSVRLQKLDLTGSVVIEDYLVMTDGTGWHCPCNDWRFRFRPHRTREAGADCKHIELGKELRKVLESLQSV